jgi:hypothetical protein
MTADAVARQYDVEKNRVILVCETDSGQYRPGTVTFYPKKGKSIDLRKIEDCLRATRLSGGTSMSVEWLEITVTGEVIVGDGGSALLKVAGTNQQLALKQTTPKEGEKTTLRRLCEEVLAGAKMVSVTGRVEGWNGRFPAVLAALGRQPADADMVLVVTGFETDKASRAP